MYNMLQKSGSVSITFLFTFWKQGQFIYSVKKQIKTKKNKLKKTIMIMYLFLVYLFVQSKCKVFNFEETAIFFAPILFDKSWILTAISYFHHCYDAVMHPQVLSISGLELSVNCTMLGFKNTAGWVFAGRADIMLSEWLLMQTNGVKPLPPRVPHASL